jgi:uncharacterized membrane protein YhdT
LHTLLKYDTERVHMAKIALTLLLLAILYLIVRTIAAFLRVREDGVHQTDELLRGNVTLAPLLKGEVAEPSGGSMVPSREGIRMSSTRQGLKVKTTRTVARDII